MTDTLLPDEADERRMRRAQQLRRAGATLLVAFVLAGALGAFGTRTRTTERSAGGYTVTVTHPAVSRPGHAVRFEVLVRGDQPLGDPVRVRMRSDYFDLFDENGFEPAPDTETTDGEWTYYEFTPSEGRVLRIKVDTRVEPARQRGTFGQVDLVDADGTPLVEVPFRTRVFP